VSATGGAGDGPVDDGGGGGGGGWWEGGGCGREQEGAGGGRWGGLRGGEGGAMWGGGRRGGGRRGGGRWRGKRTGVVSLAVLVVINSREIVAAEEVLSGGCRAVFLAPTFVRTKALSFGRSSHLTTAQRWV